MKTKLHFGILIVLFAFLGRYLESSALPNQQIVIQFSDADITKHDAENTIEAVQLKLQSIGAEHIQIGENHEGQLKITYYSNADVEQIQNILSQEDLRFTYTPEKDNPNRLPKSKKYKDYELNISEIQKSNSTDWDFEGVQVVELQQKSDRLYNPKVNTTGDLNNSERVTRLVKVTVKAYEIISLAIDNLSYKIPEVRAGPLA